MTYLDLMAYKKKREKIAVLSCYDATFANVMTCCGVDILLVGDSLGMVIQGKKDTLSVTIEAMSYHTSCVRQGTDSAFILADMPYFDYTDTVNETLRRAQLLLKSGANMVKLELYESQKSTIFQHIQLLIQHQIPVCGHIGFTPQAIHELGGYRVQGKTSDEAQKMIDWALLLEELGIELLILEMIPADLAKEITEKLRIPTIGIGAGIYCDGQVLVLQDMLGIYWQKTPPRFVRNFLENNGNIQNAISQYVQAVKQGYFPEKKHSF